MRKKTIAILLGIGTALGIIGLVAFFAGAAIAGSACSPDCSGQATPLVPTIAAFVGLGLFLIGMILGFVSWIGALVRQAKRQQWGWFAGTLISGVVAGVLTSICMLIYLLAVPEQQAFFPVYLPMQPHAADVQYQPMLSYQSGEQYHATPYPSTDPYQATSEYPPIEPYNMPPQG